jgi:ribosomal 30S subunit maturation factor RimM
MGKIKQHLEDESFEENEDDYYFYDMWLKEVYNKNKNKLNQNNK